MLRLDLEDFNISRWKDKKMKKQRTMEARIKVKKTGEKTKVKGSGKGKATPKRPKTH